MTIKEVARMAGVSSASVSRYFNGGPLSKEKKEKIARAIEETGFRPNLMAKTMRTGKVRQVGIILPRIFSESANQLMDGIAGELLEKDYLTLLGYSDTRQDRELQYLDLMQSNSVAGIILMGTTLSDIKRLSLENCPLPLVIVNSRPPSSARLICIVRPPSTDSSQFPPRTLIMSLPEEGRLSEPPVISVIFPSAAFTLNSIYSSAIWPLVCTRRIVSSPSAMARKLPAYASPFSISVSFINSTQEESPLSPFQVCQEKAESS